MKCPYKVFRNGRYFSARNPLWTRGNPYEPRRIKRRTRELAKAELARLWALFVKDEISVSGEPRRVLEGLERRRRASGMDWVAFHAMLNARLDAPAAESGATGPVGDVIERFLLTKEQMGLRRRTLLSLKYHLGRFREDFPGRIEEVSAPAVRDWFLKLKKRRSGKPMGARSRNNFLEAVQNLFHSAELKGSAQARAIAELRPIDLESPDKAIWTPDQLRELLRQAQLTDHRVIPVLVLGAFAALRTAEAMRLDASLLKLKATDRYDPWKAGFVIIKSHTTKVKKKRTVPCPENLVEWLRAFAPRSGPMWEGSASALHWHLRRLCARAGLRWLGNGLRRTASTYRDMVSHDTRRQSRDAGNSAGMLERHYLHPDAADEEAPKAWFAIQPGDGIQGKLPFGEVPNESPSVVRVAFS